MDNKSATSTPHSGNTSTLPTTLHSAELRQWNALQTGDRWIKIKEAGKFEEEKAFSSLLALPENLPRVRPLTFDQAVSDVFPTVATVGKYHGKDAAKDAVIEIVGQAAALLNVGKNLQAHQIEFLADEIRQSWYFLTIGEIRFVMENGVRGKYGELYDRLDTNVVLGWFEKYGEMRADRMEEKAVRAHLDRKEHESKTAKEMPEELRALANLLRPKYLVNGEEKAGFIQGEWEPDAPVFRMIEQEWADLPEYGRQPYENYKALRIAQIKAQMKK